MYVFIYLFIHFWKAATGLMQFVTCQCQCSESTTCPGPVESLGRNALLLLVYCMMVRNLVWSSLQQGRIFLPFKLALENLKRYIIPK